MNLKNIYIYFMMIKRNIHRRFLNIKKYLEIILIIQIFMQF